MEGIIGGIGLMCQRREGFQGGGWKAGESPLLATPLQAPLQWSVCVQTLLQTNEQLVLKGARFAVLVGSWGPWQG